LAFLVIADTDSPRSGLVRVQSHNLMGVVSSMEQGSQ